LVAAVTPSIEGEGLGGMGPRSQAINADR